MEYNKCILLLFFLCVIVLEKIISKRSDNNCPTNDKKNCITDFGHKNLPNLTKYYYLDDILTLIPVFILYFFNVDHFDFIILFLVIRTIRILCMSVTILPKCRENCDNNSNSLYKYFTGGCHESIFSGHTSLSILSILFILPHVSNFWKILLYIYGIITSLVIISIHSHYSIDIILAWVITISSYLLYHGKINLNGILPF